MGELQEGVGSRSDGVAGNDRRFSDKDKEKDKDKDKDKHKHPRESSREAKASKEAGTS